MRTAAGFRGERSTPRSRPRVTRARACCPKAGPAEQVRASGSRIELDPMTAVERKVVHLRLKEFDGVETSSEGTEPNRYVVVHLV